MFRWLASLDEQGRYTDCEGTWFQFAAQQSAEPVYLELELSMEGEQSPPALVVHSQPVNCRVQEVKATSAGIRYGLVVDPPADPGVDDQVMISVEGAAGVPACKVELRRTRCTISTGLLGVELPVHTSAALLWHAFRRFRELIGVKRFDTGRSGKEVLVLRPRLRAPLADGRQALAGSGPHEVLDGAWGAWLLVKSGDWHDVEQEWVRFEVFLRDRLHPFVARNDAYLCVAAPMQPGQRPERGVPQATLISSFLGGDLLRTETLEEVVRGTDHLERTRSLIDRVASVLVPWHHPADVVRPLSDWQRVFGKPGKGWKLFNRYDFAQEADRKSYGAGVNWDVAFIQNEHLHHHLLGKKQPGLLPELGRIQARFGLTHGDLTPRNILCQGDHAWLIDFEHTGAGPVLADFARLEATLRLWCLTLGADGENIGTAAEQFERHLLDHFQGGAGSLEPVAALAADLGADPGNLFKVAAAVARVRQHAAAFCVEAYGDRRDYLAVLYLTVLSLLRYADGAAAQPANWRVLVSLAWVLEDSLCRLTGLTPFARNQAPLRPHQLLSRDWLAAADAPARLRYLMDRQDGRRALAPLAGTRGVWQNPAHHLDVFDHIVLVLAYVEAVLVDPIRALLDPAALDGQVADDLRRQGIALPPIPQPSADPPAPTRAEVRDLAKTVGDFVASVLDDTGRLLLKWLAVLHDVGKPGTRGLRLGKVQFLGHELYGLQMLREHLTHLFPEADLRLRMDRMILNHHLPHQLVSRFTEYPEDFDALLGGLAQGQVPARLLGGLEKYLDSSSKDFLPDFPALLLHGYADHLGGRGLSLGPTAEVILALLAFCARYEKERKNRQADGELYRRLAEYYRALNSDAAHWDKIWAVVMGHLRPWRQNQCSQRRRTGEPEPSWQELCAHIDEILRGRFPELKASGGQNQEALPAPGARPPIS